MSTVESSVSFDEASRIRIFDPEKYKQSQQLETECSTFQQKISQFHDIALSFVELVDRHAKSIEAEKLKAIGARNRVEGEVEHRRRRKKELAGLLAEKRAELARYTAQLESLQKIEAEQKLLIEKLANSEPG